ncbi:MAG: amidohydrolase family protein [Porticoccaceae bacterium]|jgi:N-acyl-D-amino-acid deacylase|nr:amidohydrolase family protein [Porticoccaceae bacterium]
MKGLARNLYIPMLILALTACVETGPSYDLILKGGIIIDGSDTVSFVGDVAISGDRIAAIGDLDSASASAVIDVTGLVVAPGFLNIHSHATPEGLATAVNMLSQGVTTEIINADGFGTVDIQKQLASLNSGGLAINVGAMIGFNSAWQEVVGLDEVRPTGTQIEKMQSLILRGLEAGAWGISAGLDYVPGYYAKTKEVEEILKPFSDWNVVFANHDRVTPESNFSSITGMSETIAIGETTGLIPLITHMKVQGWEQGSASIILNLMRSAQTSFPGGAVADVYPYLAGQTGLQSLIIPSWAQAGGRDAMLARFKDSELRAQIISEAERALELRFGGSQGVFLLQTQRELTDAMEDLELESAGEAIIQLLEESSQYIIARFGIEADLVEIMQHPTASISCDCGASTSDRIHPRYWGTYPKVLGEFVREKQKLTLENAIYKMSGLPAKTIGMDDRGFIQTGMVADITVFNPDTVIDHATYDNPSQMSDGIIHTLVNGQLAWTNGKTTRLQAGRILQRTR